jgi:hypothetical protein
VIATIGLGLVLVSMLMAICRAPIGTCTVVLLVGYFTFIASALVAIMRLCVRFMP